MPAGTNREGSAYTASYNTFAGCDIKAVLANKVIGELQAISAQVTREKVGIYTMGSPNPRSISRGKRGMAGSMIVIQFDRDAITTALGHLKFQGDIDEIRPEFLDEGSNSLEWHLRAAGERSEVTPATPLGGGIGATQSIVQQESDLTTVDSDQLVMSPWYADQIPPFDIVLSAANESGALATMAIVGTEIMNEAWGISIDDMSSEKQYTYLCRDIFWWRWVRSSLPNPGAVSGA